MASASEVVSAYFGATSKRTRISDIDDDSSAVRPIRADIDDDSSAMSPIRAGVWSPNDVSWADRTAKQYVSVMLPLIQSSSQSDGDESKNEKSRIPKTIHFIWLGSASIPEHFRSEESGAYCGEEDDHVAWNACMKSWLNFHPASAGWSIKVWTEPDVQSTFLNEDTMINRPAYEFAISNQNYGLASDILRLEILWQLGGVYADIDYLCTSSIGAIHSTFDFFCGASNCNCIEINNGIMGSAKQHILVKRMMDDIKEWFDTISTASASTPVAVAMPSSLLSSFLDDQTAASLTKASELSHEDVIRHTGPGLITRTLIDSLSEDTVTAEDMERVAVLPSLFFHPFPNSDRHSLTSSDRQDTKTFIERYADDGETRAIHLWGCSWQQGK